MYLVMAAGHQLPVSVPRYAEQKKSTPPAPVPHEGGSLATASSTVVMSVDHQARPSWFVIAALAPLPAWSWPSFCASVSASIKW